MRIVINTAHQRFGGAVQVALSFIKECIHFPEHEYHVWLGQGLSQYIDVNEFPKNFHFYYLDFGVINLHVIKKIQLNLQRLESQINPDVIIATTGPTYFKSNSPQIIGFNIPLYLYPESPYFKKIGIIHRFKLWIKKRIHLYFFKRDATAYLAQTEDVNERVKNLLKTDNVYTITNTHSRYYKEGIKTESKLSKRKKDEIRLLTLSAYYPHKDLEIIPKIANLLDKEEISNVYFIVTLPQSIFDKYIRKHSNIINVGPIKPQDCPGIYSECDIMFLPTLAECFSASYPEAMIMKKPIITSDLGFARSICGDAALYFKPTVAEDAVNKIKMLIKDKQLKDNLVLEGMNQLDKFDTPNQRAAKYLSLCKKYSKKNQL